MRRDPVVLVVVALVVALMLVFGFKMARHSSQGMATGNAQMKWHRPRLYPAIPRRQNRPPLRLPRQTSSPEFLGDLVRAMQD